jgi:uncharacterized protein YprB with RNaseH-like and TPR domain
LTLEERGRGTKSRLDRALAQLAAKAPSRHGGEGEDGLLAEGIGRFLKGAKYIDHGDGYGRIEHDLGRRGLEGLLTPEMDAFLPAVADGVKRKHPRSLLLVDIESLGFIGRPLFLIGALFVSAKRKQTWKAKLIQYLARDYSEEEAVVRAYLKEAVKTDLWLTYNGRTFDLPFIKLRATQYLIEHPESAPHIDLLPIARRLWSEQLPNCKLGTIESYILGRPRGHDISGAQIPAAYHSFVRTGEPLDMLDILKHNALDLINLLDIYDQMQLALKEAD